MSGLDDLAVMLAGAGGEGTVAEAPTVTAVTPGAAEGGSTLVEVSWRGALITAQCLDTYTTPTVGDTVLLLHHADTPYILGRLTGKPIWGGGGGTTPPTGSDYVSYSSLNPGGTLSFKQVLNAVPTGKILSLDAATYTIGSDFADQVTSCVKVPSNVAGIQGAGPDATILQMAANTSTHAGDVPTITGSSNPTKLLLVGNGNFLLKNLQLKGTPQGHYYGGIQFYPDAGPGHYMSGITVDTVKFVNSSPGYANYPPGETFQLEFNWCNAPVVINCEMDGRDPVTGTPISASPLGFNNTVSSYVQDTYCHDGVASMPTWWRCTNVHTLRLRSQLTGSGPGQYAGQAINHEQCDGTILHESPTLEPGYGSTGINGTRDSSFHFSWANDDGTHTGATSISLTNITHDAGPDTNGCFGVLAVTALPSLTVTKAGVTLAPVDTAVSSTGNASTNYLIYR